MEEIRTLPGATISGLTCLAFLFLVRLRADMPLRFLILLAFFSLQPNSKANLATP